MTREKAIEQMLGYFPYLHNPRKNEAIEQLKVGNPTVAFDILREQEARLDEEARAFVDEIDDPGERSRAAALRGHYSEWRSAFDVGANSG